MIHGVRLEAGQAKWYRNRWVRTDSFDDPRPFYNADGTRNLRVSVANTHVVNHAGKTLALVESSLPYQITDELETVGAYDFDGKLVDAMTAHPKICPVTGELHFFGYGSVFAPHVTYHRADADGNLVIDRPVDVPALTMMHDFALTANFVVFLDLPIVFDVDFARNGTGDMPYRWDDGYGARLGVLRRDDPFGEVRWFGIDPCYVFHVANAHDDGNTIVVQAVRYPELWRDDAGFDAQAVMWTWTIDMQRGTVSERQHDDRVVEFPRIDDRLATLPARYAVTVGDARLIRHDLRTGSTVEHRFGTADAPGGRERRCSCRPRWGPPTRAAAGISPTSTIPPATAATSSSSMPPTSPARRSPESRCRNGFPMVSTGTGSRTESSGRWREAVRAGRRGRPGWRGRRWGCW